MPPFFVCIWEAKQGCPPDQFPSSICQATQDGSFKRTTFWKGAALLRWISDSVPLQMLFPVLLAIQGTVGAVYCVVISSLGLLSGPLCDTGSGNYTYPFRNYSLEWVAFMALGPCLTSKDDTVMTTKSVCSENWLCSSGARYLHSYLVSCSSLCTR